MVRTFNSLTTSDSKATATATATATTYVSHWLLIFHWILPSCKTFLICYRSTLRMSRWSNHWKVKIQLCSSVRVNLKAKRSNGSVWTKYWIKFFSQWKICSLRCERTCSLNKQSDILHDAHTFWYIWRYCTTTTWDSLASRRERTQKAGTDLE